MERIKYAFKAFYTILFDKPHVYIMKGDLSVTANMREFTDMIQSAIGEVSDLAIEIEQEKTLIEAKELLKK